MYVETQREGEQVSWDFPGGPVVKNLPSSAGDMGSISDQGTNIPGAAEQLSPHTTTREPTSMPQQRPSTAKIKKQNNKMLSPQRERGRLSKVFPLICTIDFKEAFDHGHIIDSKSKQEVA